MSCSSGSVPKDDPWEPEWSDEEGVYPEEIEDPWTRWSALDRLVLEALELSSATTRIREQELEERTEALFQERLLRELAGQAGTPDGVVPSYLSGSKRQEEPV